MQDESDARSAQRERDRTRPGLSRRSFLVATTGLAAGLAGCSGGDQNDSEPAATSQNDGEGPDGDDGPANTTAQPSDDASGGVFEEITFEGRELMAAVSDDAVARVNVIQDGEQVGSGEFPTGASRAAVFDANQTLSGEEFKLVAVDGDGNEVDSTTASFAADPTVTRIRSRAVKNDRETTAEAIDEHVEEFQTALVTIENAGDGPLFVGSWRYMYDGTTVFLADGVPQAVGAEKRDSLDEPDERVLVGPGDTVEVVPFVPTGNHLSFKTTGGENEEWPESVREMGAFPDGYADGDEVEVTVVVEDASGEQFESTLTATYSGGLYQYKSFGRSVYVAREFSGGT